jgi:hypothetical protein
LPEAAKVDRHPAYTNSYRIIRDTYPTILVNRILPVLQTRILEESAAKWIRRAILAIFVKRVP